MAFNSQTSWDVLGRLRRRGQRPAGPVFVTDDWRQRANLEAAGAFAVPLPESEDATYAAGLEVVLLAAASEKVADAAQRLAAANPRTFVTYFRGRGAEVVL